MAAVGIVPCALCSRTSRGFGYVHLLKRDRYPAYYFCSKRCLDGGARLARRQSGMIDKTLLEQQAIRDARRSLAEALTELGLLAPFHDRKPDEIDRIIEACIDGFQASMQVQANRAAQPFDDDLPF
jgi:hypothetical protein